MVDEAVIGEKYRLLAGGFDERGMRRWAAAEALTLGRGGTTAVARATGIAESTIRRGGLELASGEVLERGRVRWPGAGRKRLTETDPTLLRDPEAPLRWTAKSLRNLASELRGQGHEISAASVAPLLRRLGYSLQGNAKTREGARHPDRDAQFGHINGIVAVALASGEPVISVDTKKKELIGDFKTPVGNCARAVSPSASARTSSRTKRWARSIPTASTTWLKTPARSRSGSTMTPPSSRSPRSKAGGSSSAVNATRTPQR